MNTPKTLRSLLAAARQHGRDSSEPDHECGDLLALLRVTWAVLTPEQRRQVLQDPTVVENYRTGRGLSHS